MASAVDPACFDQLRMYGCRNVLAHPEDPERVDHRRHDQCLEAVDPVQLRHNDIRWQHTELLRYEQCGNDEVEQHVFEWKFVFGERITGQCAEEHDRNGHHS
ncbi:hypothetical protein D3C87_1836290 [compost metagenome]